MHKTNRIEKLLEWLDSTLRAWSWPSSSSDSCATLFKIANLAISDQRKAGRAVVGWDTSHGLLAYLLQRVRQDVMSLSPTAISQCLWAVGKSLLRLVTTERHTSGIESMQQTLDALATELVARGPLSLAPQVLATSCYGIAKGGYVSARLEHLFDAVEEALCGSTQQQQLANFTHQVLNRAVIEA